jgi:K+-sensing histidine kinase KdpD
VGKLCPAHEMTGVPRRRNNSNDLYHTERTQAKTAKSQWGRCTSPTLDPASNRMKNGMRPQIQLSSSLTSAIGVVFCTWAAAMICMLFQGRPTRALIPVVFLVVVTLVAMRCGIIAGIIGSAISALIFATFLFHPLGSVSVANPAARTNLAWLIVGGLAFSYLLAPIGRGPQRR